MAAKTVQTVGMVGGAGMAGTVGGPKYSLVDVQTRDWLQQIINQIKASPKTIESLQVVAPPSMRVALLEKYSQLLQTHPDLAWSQIVQDITLTLISISIQFSFQAGDIYYITIPALESAFHQLYPSTAQEIMQEPRTFYFFLTAGLDMEVMQTAFHRYGFQDFIPGESKMEGESKVQGSGLGVILLGGDPTRETPVAIRKMQQYPCVVKNFLDDRRKAISDKWVLYQNMQRLMGVYPELAGTMPETSELRLDTPIQEGKIYIIRPIGRGICGGKGVVAVSTAAEARQVYRDHRSCRQIQRSIITDYFPQPPTLPLLYEGRKMHFRMFFLVRAASDRASFYTELWRRGRIVTATDPYQTGHWTNPNIHDTHSHSTPHNLWFPEDLPDITMRHLLYARMQQIAVGLHLIMESNAYPYPESKYAFHVFGLDLLADQHGNVILIEANDKSGLYSIAEPPTYTDNEVSRSFYVNHRYTFQDFTQDYFDWIYTHGIHPFYGGPTPILKTFSL